MPESTACIICGQSRPSGISVCGHFICQVCEQAIVETGADDPTYNDLVRKLKQLWQATGEPC